MDSSTTIHIIILLFLLMCSAFFSASETSLMSLSKIRLRHMVDEKVKHAELLERLINQPSKLLGAILIGNNIVNIGASSLATSLAIRAYGNAGIGIATGVMTFLVLIFGEITPKTLAAENSEKISLAVVKIINFLTIILAPLLYVTLKLTSFIVRLLGGSGNSERPFVTEEELKMMVTVSHEEGIIESEEKKMIHNVFEFGDEQVKAVMTPRMDMASVPITATYQELINYFKESQFSRLPVYEDNRDNMIGIVYLKDIFYYDGNPETFNISDLIRKPYFTYELKKTAELFIDLKKHHMPMAIVLDEYGGTAGIVTIEDLVEEIVGELRDEYDDSEIEIEALKDNEFIVDGRTKIDMVNETLAIKLPEDEFDTIGGFVTGALGRMGKIGDTLDIQEVNLQIIKMHKNRIMLLKIRT